MFEGLAIHPKIAVTGPQRSGTTITARIVSADTGHRFVDEREFGVYSDDRFNALLEEPGPFVVQCPHMLKPIVDARRADLFVVLVRRDLDAIHLSEARIGWEARGHKEKELRRFGLDDGDPATTKYDYWDSRPKVPKYLEVSYDELAGHPLFVEQALRKQFRPKQTRLEAPRSGKH